MSGRSQSQDTATGVYGMLTFYASGRALRFPIGGACYVPGAIAVANFDSIPYVDFRLELVAIVNREGSSAHRHGDVIRADGDNLAANDGTMGNRNFRDGRAEDRVRPQDVPSRGRDDLAIP